ncbi:hypothetical protein GF325_12580 [Candidatus Bathyarchaeota archaeon]|nr:hypothetical protein [Candidatus Bathyarchaeota archaeon]
MNDTPMEFTIPYISTKWQDEWSLQAEFLMGTGNPWKLVVLCHPHPQFGGSMQNNIISCLFEGLPPGFSTLRFNFSGVGASTGNHEDGNGEMDQVRAAITYMLGDFSQKMMEEEWEQVHVVGYSFGAAVSMPVALSMKHITSFTSISFPFDMFDTHAKLAVQAQARSHVPVFLLMGDMDDFTTVEAFNNWCTQFPGPLTRDILLNGDHFLSGHELEVLAKVRKFLKVT